MLIVDDDARVRAAIGETIRMEPDLLLVGAAANATAAMAMATAGYPDVSLVDVLLPDVGTGLALVTSLSAIKGCSVVAMSVRSAIRGVALAAGAVSFVEKGDDIESLLRSVRVAASSDH